MVDVRFSKEFCKSIIKMHLHFEVGTVSLKLRDLIKKPHCYQCVNDEKNKGRSIH